MCFQLEQDRISSTLARHNETEREELERRQQLYEEQMEAELRLQEEERGARPKDGNAVDKDKAASDSKRWVDVLMPVILSLHVICN